MRGIIGKKLGMTQLFDQDGNFVPVTVVEVAPNHVLQVKTAAGKDGYNAVKLAAGAARTKNMPRPEQGVFKSAKIEPQKTVIEFRLSEAEIAQFKQGDVIDGGMLVEGALVDVKGVSKGKGFAGVIKRHGFKGAKESSHGTHEYERHGGAIGMNTYPGRVFKNKRMAGQMGNANVTVRNLKVVGIYADENLVLLSGSVPGAAGSIVRIFETKAKKEKRVVAAPTAKKK
jgi:large subunit ribosomal protein L3